MRAIRKVNPGSGVGRQTRAPFPALAELDDVCESPGR